MFNSSLRQVARTRPSATISTRQTTATSSSKSIATFTTRSHQRRHSSSKPPIPPNNGSPSIPATSVKQVGAPRSSDKRPGTESRLSKRKVVKGEKTESSKQMLETKGNEWTLQMPSVPSTQHLNPKDVYIASFFSTHRPISISGPLPPETQIEEFDKIFQARPKRSRNGAAEVIYTLTSAVQNMDEHIHRGQSYGAQQSEHQTVEQRTDLIKTLTQHNNLGNENTNATHLDGQPQRIQGGNVKLMIQEIARRFRPFHAPPAPVPAPEVDFLSKDQAQEAEVEANEEMQAKNLELEIERQDGQKMILQLNNIEEAASELRSGQFFTSQNVISEPQSSANMTDPSSQPAYGRKTRRRVYSDPKRSRRNMRIYAISVKRQRKLKMKKHKYKKLMRKTRNLRRRQDRL